MKKSLFYVFLITALFIQKSFSQAHVPGPAERKITDSICSCVSKLDVSKITTKEEATQAYTGCVLKHAGLLPSLAAERNVDISDNKAMVKIGEDIAITLLKEECKGFKEIATLLGQDEGSGNDDLTGSATGVLKRIENKGFNYFVINDAENNEKTFIWLRQFTGSEIFMTGDDTKYIGKKILIKYKELEVFLPQAKGYYKVKEIASITVL